MGAWGYGPSDNDSAADFMSDATESLCEHALAVLRDTDEQRWQEHRAAAHLVSLLGHVYTWNIRTLHEALVLAVDRLGEGIETVQRVTVDWQEAVTLMREEQRVLQERLDEQRTRLAPWQVN